MPLLILLIIVIGAIIWWLSGNRALSLNERLYLKRRGYAPDLGTPSVPGPPVSPDTRLNNLLESLGDLSPYSRQRAAEDLSEMCVRGERDARMFSALVTALDDGDASVRAAVAVALANLGDQRATDRLRRRLELEESIQARTSIRRAIEKLG
jgi:HEAT repeat protein